MSHTVPCKEKFAVAALVVGFKPNYAALDSLLLTLLGEVEAVILLDNGSSSNFLAANARERGGVRYVSMGGNKGLGAAINCGISMARQLGFRYVATFDQDSAPPPGMVAELYCALRQRQRVDPRCVALGPAFYDLRARGTHPFPLYREESQGIKIVVATGRDLEEVDTLITSGTVLDSDVWARGLKYDEELVVDYTDTEWCFRVRSNGYRLFVLPSVCMPHALSDAAPARCFGITFLRYSPLRRYYYFRNTIYFMRQSCVSRAWRRRLGLGLILRLFANPFIDVQPARGVYLSLKGVWHGMIGKRGIYRE